MEAIVVERFGGPEVLVVRELPDPQLGPGQALIEVAVVSVTFVETQVRAGRGPGPSPPLPWTPGNGVAGVVSAVADDVEPSLVGTRVVATTGGRGGYAERAVVDAADLIPVPAGLTLRDAAALLADGRTALALARRAELQPDARVLVLAAAGGVGACLVQLATQAGAQVVAAAGGPDKLAAVQAYQPALAVDYSRAGWVEVVRRQVGDLDAVFDGVGGEVGEAALGLLRPGGRFCAYGMASGRFSRVGAEPVEFLAGTGLTPGAMHQLSAEALQLAVEGKLRPLIGQVVPLEQAAAAHAAIEAREVVGKTLLATARLTR